MSERQKKKLAQREANRLKRRMIERVLSKGSNSAFNLNFLVDGWLELESDPGTFSLLIDDFGCAGAQVDEIYDLEQKFDGPVLGFIFLFKWLNNQPTDRARNQKSTSINSYNNNNNNQKETNNAMSDNKDGKLSTDEQHKQCSWSYVEDENIISNMFFAKQMISNSCATHALISILLNCDYDRLNLGPILTRLKEHTRVMDPENKGYAIGNLPELAKAHNSHASYSSLYNRSRSATHSASGMSYMISGNQRTNLQQNLQEAYHFVSYVPINNRLYELDGLKNYPIDHGPIEPKQDWTEKFRSVIKQRLFANGSGDDPTMANDIRYNLMAVVPDKRFRLRSELKELREHHEAVEANIKRLTKKIVTPLSIDVDIPNPPYSPLSNVTMTASEASSPYHSPVGSPLCDDDDLVEKFLVIKFNQNIPPTTTSEDNSDLAHKNCIIEIESTDISAIDLTTIQSKEDGTVMGMQTNGGTIPSVEDNIKNEVSTKIRKADNPRICEQVDQTGLEDSTESAKITSAVAEASLKTTTNLSSTSSLSSLHVSKKARTNGYSQSDTEKMDEMEVVNVNQAHNNELYNLSTKPPFDFNILDDLQHVHVGKSDLRELVDLSKRLSKEIEKLETSLKEEMDKRSKFKIDNSRRTHNYEPFIMTFLSLLAKHGNLADLIEKDLGMVGRIPEETTQAQVSSPSIKTPKPATNAPTTPVTTSTKTVTGDANARKVSAANGVSVPSKLDPNAPKISAKPKYKYVSTGRPVGRPRKNPIVNPAVKNNTNTK